MKKVIISICLLIYAWSCVEATPAPSANGDKVVYVSVDTKNHKKHPPKRHPKKRKKAIKTIVIGTRVKTIPAKHTVIVFNSIPYIYADGVFYKEISSCEYEIVKPHIGIIVSSLPSSNVLEVNSNNKILLNYGGTLFEPINTDAGIKYKVIGFINQ